jgi:hypothetical protein
VKNVLQQIEDNQAERQDAAAAAGLEQEMADNRRLLASTAESLRDRQAEHGGPEAGE